jgi:lysophospholipase L1-like esterase
MLGDSITWSGNVPFGHRYGDFIERNLQTGWGPEVLVDVAVCGDGSDTVAQGLVRVERDVLAYAPDYVLVNLGCNNLIRERKFLEADLRLVIQRIRKADPATSIVLETIPFIDERRHCYRRLPEIRRAGGLNNAVERIHAIIRKLAGEFDLALHD